DGARTTREPRPSGSTNDHALKPAGPRPLGMDRFELKRPAGHSEAAGIAHVGWERSRSTSGPLYEADQLKQEVRLVSLHPRVVPGRHHRHVARLEHEVGAVFHDHALPPRQDVLHVVLLAALGADGRLHVLRPPPSGLERLPTEDESAEGHDLDPALVEGTPRLIGRVEALLLQPGDATRHVPLLAP